MVGRKNSGSRPKELEAGKSISWDLAFESNLSYAGPPNKKFFYDNMDSISSWTHVKTLASELGPVHSACVSTTLGFEVGHVLNLFGTVLKPA